MRNRRVLDLFDELEELLRRLAEAEVDYALCGGLAMAVYGVSRATVDIDLLVPSEALAGVWRDRRELTWEAGRLWVVSREGLAAMKRLRGSGQDLDDIAALE